MDNRKEGATPLRPVGCVEHALVVIGLIIVVLLGLWWLASTVGIGG